VVALQNLLDPAVEVFDDASGLGRPWRGRVVLNFERRAELVKLVLCCRGTLAQAEVPIRELLAVIGQNGADTDRAGAYSGRAGTAAHWPRLRREDADEHPAGRPVDGYEQVTAALLFDHLWQLFQVDMDVSRLVSTEDAVLWRRGPGFQIAQVAHTMPSREAVQARA